MDEDYKKFGIKVAKYLDNLYFLGTAELSLSLAKLLFTKLGSKSLPLDWNGENWQQHYQNESSVLWITRNGRRIYFPQKIILGPWDEILNVFEEFTVELLEDNFIPPYKNESCLAFYKGKHDFNGENARLQSIDSNRKAIVFQGAKYFDWVCTNLSLDYQRQPLPTLREENSIDGKLPRLEESNLANITGINGLLFTNDGYMVYQKRNNKVLVRPGQLCSGFSGTVDKVDIYHVTNSDNPVLSNMDSAREAVEEIGIDRSDIKYIAFLGASRELIRGGTPELFYSVDLNLSRKQVLDAIPRDREGTVHCVSFGMYAKSIKPVDSAILESKTLWLLLEQIATEFKAPISLPFLTNLALWYWQWDTRKVGCGTLPK